MLERVFSIEAWRNLFTKHGQKVVMTIVVFFGLSMVIQFGMNGFGRGNQGRAEVAQAQNAVIATVNGDPITQIQFVTMAQRARSSAPPGEQFATMQGQIMQQLVIMQVIQQEAKKRNVRASDADIDRQLQQEREQLVPKGASDADWEAKVEEMHGQTLSDYRETISKQMAGLALEQSFANDEKVTEDEAKNQNAEVKFNVVLVSSQDNSNPMMPKDKKALPDAEAKKKAEALLAKVKGGADIASVARTDSSDFTAKQGGDSNWRPEFKERQGMPATMGTLGYGKDFDEVIRKAAKGGLTDVIKVTGFQSGYAFAKVADRRVNLPKDFDVKKAAEALKKERADKKLSDYLKAQIKAAKVEVKDADKKAFYDLAELRQKSQEQMMAKFGQGDPATAPTEEDVKKLQAQVETEFEEMLKKHPDDPTAALVVASNVKTKRTAKGTTAEQATQLRDRLISLYETALKQTEDREIRFELADLYRDKKQTEEAAREYLQIVKIMDRDPAYDMQSMQSSLTSYQKVETALRTLSKTEDADKLKTKIAKLQTDLAEESRKQAEAQKAAQAASKKPASGAPTLTLPDAGKDANPAASTPDAGKSAPGAKTP